MNLSISTEMTESFVSKVAVSNISAYERIVLTSRKCYSSSLASFSISVRIHSASASAISRLTFRFEFREFMQLMSILLTPVRPFTASSSRAVISAWAFSSMQLLPFPGRHYWRFEHVSALMTQIMTQASKNAVFSRGLCSTEYGSSPVSRTKEHLKRCSFFA